MRVKGHLLNLVADMRPQVVISVLDAAEIASRTLSCRTLRCMRLKKLVFVLSLVRDVSTESEETKSNF
jgi:hypothetical protein